MQNNIVSTSINSSVNPDGTITETKTELYANGTQTVTTTKYDRNHNIISQQSQSYDNNNYNFGNNFCNNINIQSSVDGNGNTIQTRTQQLPNGQTVTTRTITDRNGNVLSSNTSNSFGGNNMNNLNNLNMHNFNMGMNNMARGMNNMMRGMSNMMGGMMSGMNNMFGGMNNMMNDMGNMMNNMSNMGYMQPNDGRNNRNYYFNNMTFNVFDNNQEMPQNGVEPSLLRNFSPSKLKDVSNLEDDKKNCIICMEDFKNGDEVIYIPCLHVFHKNCILEWFKIHNDCPICKYKITFENLNSGS